MKPTPDPLPLPPGARPESQDDASTQALAGALRSSFVILKIIMVVLVAAFLGSGFFTVGTQEKAILLRFGKPVGAGDSLLLGPGAHFAFPRPIDEVVKIPVGEVLTVKSTVGWYFTTPALEAARNEPPPDKRLSPVRDGYLLTGDGNIVHARGSLRYRIQEPGLRYKLDFAAASNLVENALNLALVYAAAHSTVEITRDATPFREKVQERLRQLIEEQKLGVVADQVDVQVIAPRQVAEDFARVTEAEIRRNTAINNARKYETETLSAAQAEAQGRLNAAAAQRQGITDLVAADANRFASLLVEYRRNPQLFKDLRLAEVSQRIFTNVSEKIVLQERADGLPRELRLLLGREPLKAAAPADTKSGDHKH